MNISVLFVLAVAVAVFIRLANQTNRRREIQKCGVKKVAKMFKKL